MSKGVFLWLDFARLHSAMRTVEALQQLQSEVFVRPAYIADLAPLELNLLDSARDATRGHQFAVVQEVKELLLA